VASVACHPWASSRLRHSTSTNNSTSSNTSSTNGINGKEATVKAATDDDDHDQPKDPTTCDMGDIVYRSKLPNQQMAFLVACLLSLWGGSSELGLV
jgi:hypothetical protein